jgi:hypothetical protein
MAPLTLGPNLMSRATLLLLIGALISPQAASAQMMIMAGRPIPPRKSESENLIAFFTETGRVIRGDRHYSTFRTPASRSEDRHGGLFAADTAKIERIAKAVVARCGG